MKYRFISAHRETFIVGHMCKLLNVSRSGYYFWLKRPVSRRRLENRALKDKIRVLHAASHGIYGAPKIHQDLVDAGIRCGKNRVARIMRDDSLRSRTKKKFKATTNSRHNFPVAPNLLNQDFTMDAPDRAWVGDITYSAPRLGISRGAYPWNACNKKNKMPCFSLWKSMSPSGGDLLLTGRVT